MPRIMIDKETYKRIRVFQQVVETVIGETMSLDTCAETILARGLDLMLADLLGHMDRDVMLKSIQKLAELHPKEVYGFVDQAIKKGRPSAIRPPKADSGKGESTRGAKQ